MMTSNSQEFSPLYLSQILEQKYGIADVRSITELSGGDSRAFRVHATSGNYVLKVMKTGPMNNSSVEPRVTALLSEHGVPVHEFCLTLDGQVIWESGGCTMALYRFIPGKVYERNTAPGWLSSESAVRIGQIHEILEQMERLDDGIGAAWYLRTRNGERLRQKYERTLRTAESAGDESIASDVRFRLSLLHWVEDIDLDFDRMTRCNTHGDYHIRQIVCAEDRIRAIIDFSSSCVHPVSWEVLRSYSIGDPACCHGHMDTGNLKSYIHAYLRHGKLSKYDLHIMPYLYLYQLVVCDYHGQYYTAMPGKEAQSLDLATWSTALCSWLNEHAEDLSRDLVKSF